MKLLLTRHPQDLLEGTRILAITNDDLSYTNSLLAVWRSSSGGDLRTPSGGEGISITEDTIYVADLDDVVPPENLA